MSRWYDLATVPLELLLFRPLRSRLLRSAAGRVLEVAVGTGLSHSRYPPGVDFTAVDLSLGMLSDAHRRSVAKAALMDAEQLAFRNALSTLLCRPWARAPFVIQFSPFAKCGAYVALVGAFC